MRGEIGVAIEKNSKKKTIEDVKSVSKKINSKDSDNKKENKPVSRYCPLGWYGGS